MLRPPTQTPCTREVAAYMHFKKRANRKTGSFFRKQLQFQTGHRVAAILTDYLLILKNEFFSVLHSFRGVCTNWIVLPNTSPSAVFPFTVTFRQHSNVNPCLR
jgi:hypothetical protein